MRKGIYKDLKKCAVCAEADSLKPDALVKWMQSTAKRGGVQLSREMAELLVEISGGEMYALKNELDKLKFAGQKRPGRGGDFADRRGQYGIRHLCVSQGDDGLAV